MKVTTTSNKKTRETQPSDKVLQDKTKEYLNSGGVPFQNIIQEGSISLKQEFSGVESLLNSPDYTGLNDFLKADFVYDTLSISQNDADFFINMVSDGQFSFQVQQQNDLNFTLSDISVLPAEEASKSIEVSKTLTNLIEKSMQTQKPVRIDFDNDISVIMKISRDGKISADFVPSTNEVERYLRNNIPMLVQKFEEQNLPYEKLSYRQSRQDNKKNKGE